MENTQEMQQNPKQRIGAEEEKAKREVQGALRLEKKMSEISSGLEKLGKTEEDFERKGVSYYRDLEKHLYELLTVLRNAWQGQRNIRQALLTVKNDPKYADQANKLFQSYNGLVQKAFVLLNNLDDTILRLNKWFDSETARIVKDEKRFEKKELIYEKKSGKGLSNAEQVMENIIKDLKNIAKIKKRLPKTGEELRAAVQRSEQEIRFLIARYDEIFKLIKELRVATSNARKIFEKVKGLNKKSSTMVKGIIKAVNGLKRGKTVIDGWKPKDIKMQIRYTMTSNFAWLKEQDMRRLWEELEKLLNNIQLKIEEFVKAEPVFKKQEDLVGRMVNLDQEIEDLELEVIEEISTEKGLIQ